MNDLLAMLILAVVQGITEFIPVSSSAHLIFVSQLLNYDLSLQVSVALHLGTLMAVFVYFRQDIINIIRDLCSFKFKTPDGKLGLALLIAAIPAALTGFLLRNVIAQADSSLLAIALGLGITSLFLFIASLKTPTAKLSFPTALIIGLVQIASLFRGISRSGSTISTALFLGIDIKTAVKFSYLLSIPIILGANILELGTTPLSPLVALPALISFGVGLAAAHLSFKHFLTHPKNLRFFALYTLLLALGIGIHLLLI